MTTLADLLEAQSDHIVACWTQRVVVELPEERRATPSLLIDHLPAYLRELIVGLRALSPDPTRASVAARQHAAQRFRLGFDVNVLVAEYGVLRRCMLQAIEEAGHHLTMPEMRALSDFIGEGIADAVREYTQQQRSQLQQANLDRSEREAWSTTTLASIGDAVIATDADGFVTFLNHTAELLTGWAQDDAGGRPLPDIFQIVDAHTRAPLENPMERVRREGKATTLTGATLLCRRDGSYVAVGDSAAPIRSAEGTLLGFVVVFRDDTDKQRDSAAIAELLQRERLARSQADLERARLHAVFEQSPVGVCIIEGPEHIFTFANPAYRALVGNRDVAGKRLHDALPEVRDQGFDRLLDGVMQTGQPFFGREVSVTLEHHGPGEALFANFIYSAKRNVDGRIDGVLVTAVDVTEQVLARRRAEALLIELRESEERLRRVVDASSAGTWEVDRAPRRVDADEHYRELLGLPLDGPLTVELAAQGVHVDDQALARTRLGAAIAGHDGGRIAVEHRVGGHGQTPLRWIEVRGQVLFAADGQPTRVVGTVVDITARKHFESAIADERYKLEAIFQESPAAMGMWRGAELVFEKVNPQYQAIFSDRELLGRPIAEALPELIDQGFVALLRSVLDTGQPIVGRETLVRLAPRQGGPLEDHYYDFTYVRINDAAGQPYGVYDHAIDVTERVVAKRESERLFEQLQRSEDSLRTLAEAIPQQVWTATAQGALDFVNQRVASYFAAPLPQLLASGWLPFVHPNDAAECATRWQRSLATGEPFEAELRLRAADGSFRWHLSRAQASRDGGGHVVKWFGTHTDIDETKRVREQLGAARSLAEALRLEAESANRAKDEFLAMLGHEMRNPLAPITTALQLMRLRGETAFARERDTIERQVDHLTRLVDDLLDVSRITRGKIAITTERVDMGDVVARALEMASPLLEQRQQHLTLTLATEPLMVQGDPRRLAQVLSNLLTNAAKYTDPGGRIELSSERDGHEIVLRVRDNGVGIGPDMLPHIFNLFVQERQSIDRARGGLGLGLAIVRTLVGLHGGRVQAESAGRGQGTTLTVRLPAASASALASDEAATARAGGALGTLPKAVVARRVLIVDDNVDAAELLAETLTYLGHEARVAPDGPSALRLVDEFTPDVAVLDIGLPVMDGYELAARLRERPALRQTQMVALTGYGQASDQERSIRAGFDAHLVKPVQLDVLEEIIGAGP